MGRNVMRAPSQRRLDLALAKSTRINERLALDFRVEGYNVTNTPNFRAPQADISTDDFARYLTPLAARVCFS